MMQRWLSQTRVIGREDRLAEGAILRLEVEEGDGFDHGLAGHPAW